MELTGPLVEADWEFAAPEALVREAVADAVADGTALVEAVVAAVEGAEALGTEVEVVIVFDAVRGVMVRLTLVEVVVPPGVTGAWLAF